MCIAQDKRRRYDGFTLLEITLAVAILGMMALHYGLERRHQAGT